MASRTLRGLRRASRPPASPKHSSVAADAAAGRIDIVYVSPERAMVLGAAFFQGLLRGRCAARGGARARPANP